MKILIATDGSEASKQIIEATCGVIGKPENTIVKIVSAVEPVTPMAAEPFAISAQYYGELTSGLSKQAKTAVEQAAADLKKACPNLKEVSSDILHGGAARAVVEAASDWGANLIVVGSHGYGFWSRALLGSVSNAVVQHAPCSVLVVRGKGE